jgi:hypothetical protein
MFILIIKLEVCSEILSFRTSLVFTWQFKPGTNSTLKSTDLTAAKIKTLAPVVENLWAVATPTMLQSPIREAILILNLSNLSR